MEALIVILIAGLTAMVPALGFLVFKRSGVGDAAFFMLMPAAVVFVGVAVLGSYLWEAYM